MSKRQLPQLDAFHAREGLDFEVTPAALQRWNAGIQAAAADENTISIYGFIGESWDGSGITAARIAGALRAIGDKDVVVNVNSPGGSAFEGIAIYNLLRQHPKNVTVRVVGLAASAASIIAMAGDTVEIGQAAFLMIHNVLMLAIGNRNDLRAAADTMEPIDRALADLYAARTGKEPKAISKMMDAETWLGGQDAIDQGFADSMMDGAAVKEDSNKKRNAAQARAEIQNALAKAGYSRSRQRELIKEFGGTPGAVANIGTQVMPGADDAEPLENQPTKVTNMDMTKLKAEHPALVEALIAEGRESGMKAGADAERARIQAVEAQALPGHEALIASLKFDGKTTGPEAAVQVLNAERGKAAAKLDALRADGKDPAKVTASAADAAAEAAAAAAADAAKTPEERWEADPKLRAEFGDDKATFLAFEKANAAGKVKIMGKRAA